MATMNKLAENLLDLARNKGLIRPCDLALLGIPRVSLTRAVRRGQLERVGRGLYGLPAPKPAKVIRAADLSGKSYLETEAEVEEYLAKLRAELLAAIKAGQRARIQ